MAIFQPFNSWNWTSLSATDNIVLYLEKAHIQKTESSVIVNIIIVVNLKVKVDAGRVSGL